MLLGAEDGDEAMPLLPYLPSPSPQAVEAFRALYFERFGRCLTQEQASDLAARYLLIYSLGTTTVDKASSLSTMKEQKS